jgi:TPR repeat protein
MADHRARQFLSAFRAVLFAWPLVATFTAADPAGAVDDANDEPRHPATAHLQRLREHADEGSALAQYVLGAMYQLGEVVPQDYTEAAKWFRRAADQDLAVAQFALGEMYALGQGVPEDIVHAHMWLDLSGAHAARIVGAQKLARDAQEMRDTLARKMTPAQVREAQKLARDWKPKPER